MERTYKKYDEDYKKNIVKLVEGGKPVADISREYGLARSAIYSWVKKYRTITTSTGEITSNDELDKIRKENRLLKEENEILKKPWPYLRKNRRQN